MIVRVKLHDCARFPIFFHSVTLHQFCIKLPLYVADAQVSPNEQRLALGHQAFFYAPVEKYSNTSFPTDPIPLVYIFDIATRQMVFALPEHRWNIEHLTWHSDSNRLLTIDQSQTLRIWDISAQKLLYSQDQHAMVSEYYDLAPLGDLLAIADTRQNVLVWNLEQNLLQTTLVGHTAPVRFMAWRPESVYWHDIPMLVTYANRLDQLFQNPDQSIRIWNGKTG